MNRLASVLAGAATAAVSGAVIAAAAVGQGVFDGSPTKSASSQDTVQVAATIAETAEATVATPEPQIVYVDKEPIYITRTVVQPVASLAAPNTPTEQPSATPTPMPMSPQLQASTEQPTRPAATLAPATPTRIPTRTTTVSRTGDDHEGTQTTGRTGRTSGHDD